MPQIKTNLKKRLLVSMMLALIALCKHVIKTVNDFGFQLRFIGQTYDGVAVMAKQISSLQKQAQDIYPEAFFTHCYSHVLNC
jgi:hypothetical protein